MTRSWMLGLLCALAVAGIFAACSGQDKAYPTRHLGFVTVQGSTWLMLADGDRVQAGPVKDGATLAAVGRTSARITAMECLSNEVLLGLASGEVVVQEYRLGKMDQLVQSSTGAIAKVEGVPLAIGRSAGELRVHLAAGELRFLDAQARLLPARTVQAAAVSLAADGFAWLGAGKKVTMVRPERTDEQVIPPLGSFAWGGGKLYVAETNGTLTYYIPENSNTVRIDQVNGRIDRIKLSADRQYLVVIGRQEREGRQSGLLWLYHLRENRIFMNPYEQPIVDAALDAGSRYLAVSSGSLVEVRDLLDGMKKKLISHEIR